MSLRGAALLVVVLTVAAACSGSSGRSSVPTASTATTAALTARQRAKVCTAPDLSLNNVPLPGFRRLTKPRTEWFGRVRLDPVASGVQPSIPFEQAWNGVVFSGSVYGSAIYDVMLAYWTSDAGLVVQTHGRPVAHEKVLAWVAVGTHRPVEATDVDSQHLTIPGVPCYFGVSITAVNAATGQLMADALDYH